MEKSNKRKSGSWNVMKATVIAATKNNTHYPLFRIHL